MKSFFSTFAITLCLIGLAGGLLWADVRTRAVTFEESTPPYVRSESPAADWPLTAGGEVLRYLYRSEKNVLEHLLEIAKKSCK